jgi:hypothetical protein
MGTLARQAQFHPALRRELKRRDRRLAAVKLTEAPLRAALA